MIRTRGLPGNAFIVPCACGLHAFGGIQRTNEVNDDPASPELPHQVRKVLLARGYHDDLRPLEQLCWFVDEQPADVRNVVEDVVPVGPDQAGDLDVAIEDADFEPLA